MSGEQPIGSVPREGGRAVSGLTRTQRRCLTWIAEPPWPEDHACNCEGDLTIRSGNWPATAHSLLRQGLIEEVEIHSQHEEDEHCSYAVTDQGRAALAEQGDDR